MADSNTFKTGNSDFQKLKEKTVHGTPLLPFAKYHTDISEMLPFYPIHWHEEMEVIKVQSGKGSFCIDGKWYVGEEGDILILRPFVMHSINRLGENDMTIDAIVFNLRLLSLEKNDICTLKYFAPLLNEKHSLPCITRYLRVIRQTVGTILSTNALPPFSWVTKMPKGRNSA